MSTSDLQSDEAFRARIVDISRAAGVSGLQRGPLAEAFIRGVSPVGFNELGIDSLVLMELCIGIETQLSVSLSPEQAARCGSLEALTEEIIKRRH